MMEPDHSKIDIQAYEDNLKIWGVCPYMSMGMSQVPCTDKCALYVKYGYSDKHINGCAHKSIAVDLHRIAEHLTNDPTH